MALNDQLDREGEWELRSSVYRNGKLVGHVDVRSNSFADLGWQIGCAIDERDVIEHVPKPRRVRRRYDEGRQGE